VAADVLRGDMPLSHWKTAKKGFILDVRDAIELAVENVEGAVNIPIEQLRARINEIPRNREIHVICRSGQRAYYATRILIQNGFKAKTVSGGMLSLAHNYLFEANNLTE
jgi:rhodanese-related sulfurtransferase